MNDFEHLKGYIRCLLNDHRQRITPSDLIHAVRTDLAGVSRDHIKAVVRELIESRHLIYTTHFAVAHLEWNHTQPSGPSGGVIIPADGNSGSDKGRTGPCITLMPGAAFGQGDHPTTRLALRAIDYAARRLKAILGATPVAALDVGTGSGVLAIAAVHLVAQYAIGVDTDPLACYEAVRNVEANHQQHRIVIAEGSLDAVSRKRFSLVMANLRPPTLCALLPELRKVSRPPAFWVLSGGRTSEIERTRGRLPVECPVVWEEAAQNWTALVVHCRQGD